jgi:hypothetical protein
MSAEIATEPRSRRAILAALGGGLAALVAQAIGRPLPVKGTHAGPVYLADPNASTVETAIVATGPATAFRGQSVAGYGLHGVSAGGADVPKGTGVYGTSGSAADAASDTQQTGVYGFAEGGAIATGVWGDSAWTGVTGSGGDVGVHGSGFFGVVGSGDVTGVGVYAEGNTGVWAHPTGSSPAGPAPNAGLSAEAAWPKNAAHFNGRTTFTRSGKLVVPAGSSSVPKSMPLSASSLVFAVVISNRAGFWVTRVVSSPSTSSFRVHLNATVPSGTSGVYVAYFIAN